MRQAYFNTYSISNINFNLDLVSFSAHLSERVRFY